MGKTIIYVFTPKRHQKAYMKGEKLPDDLSGWVKIGKTSTKDDNGNKWIAAYKRVRGEAHTGISETCVLVDVFEYPEMRGKPDDTIRNLLTNDIYNLETSKEHNKDVAPQYYEIKAGNEYVYGVSRNQIWAAIAKFERNLLLENNSKKQQNRIIQLIKRNNETIIEDTENSEGILGDTRLKIYDAIVEELKSQNINANHTLNKNYGTISSKNQLVKLYAFKYSWIHNQSTIGLETVGRANKNKIERYIQENNVREYIALSAPIRGLKNMNKYSWQIQCVYDRFDEQHVKEWFVSNLAWLCGIFDNQTNII